jgi:hypothetical protein
MFEFYDLKNDPLEQNNLIENPAFAPLIRKYKAYLQEWMIVYQDYCPLPIEPGK